MAEIPKERVQRQLEEKNTKKGNATAALRGTTRVGGGYKNEIKVGTEPASAPTRGGSASKNLCFLKKNLISLLNRSRRYIFKKKPNFSILNLVLKKDEVEEEEEVYFKNLILFFLKTFQIGLPTPPSKAQPHEEEAQEEEQQQPASPPTSNLF